MPYFPVNLGAQRDNKRLSSDQNMKQTIGPIKFVLECSMIKLCDELDDIKWVEVIPINQ